MNSNKPQNDKVSGDHNNGHQLDNDFEENKNQFDSQYDSNMMNFDSRAYDQGFMPMGAQNGFYYPQYGNPFMGYPMQYQGGFRGHFEKKGYGYRKHYGYTPTHTQVVYAKKPKTNTQENKDALSGEFSNLSVSEKKKSSSIERLPHKIEKAQFFVIKSYSEIDVHKAIKNNIWCSTKEGNVKLHNAFVTANDEYPIYLLFSVNSSGHFVGVAKMKSPVDFDKNYDGWGQSHKWKGVFKISWVYIKDVPNRELRHLKNDLNDGKPVPNSRDCQEVPFEIGIQVLEIFEKYKNQTSILDDYEFYEMQEKGYK